MLIPHVTYIILIVAFIIAMGGLSLFLEKRKAMKFPGVFIVIAIAFSIYLNRVFPFVYTITDCETYKTEILLAPKMINGTEITLGNKAWINNESDYYLYVEAITYGHSGKNYSDHEVEPHTCLQAKAYDIDYIFKEPPRSIRTKSNSETRYWLDCQYEDYEDEEFEEEND